METGVIRIAKFQYWSEMPSGEYAVSEGASVASGVVLVHPDDYPLLVEIDRQRAAAFKAAQDAGLTRPHWEGWHDLEWAAEDGDPLSYACIQYMQDYRELAFVAPNYEIVEGSPDWPVLPPDAKRRRK